MSETIVDKALVGATWLQITPSGDMKITTGVLVNFQTIQIRALSEISTWLQDDSFGSTIMQIFKEKWPYTVSDDDMTSAITSALKPMIDDGRVTSIDSVRVLKRDFDSIYVEAIITSGNSQWKIPIIL